MNSKNNGFLGYNLNGNKFLRPFFFNNQLVISNLSSRNLSAPTSSSNALTNNNEAKPNLDEIIS